MPNSTTTTQFRQQLDKIRLEEQKVNANSNATDEEKQKIRQDYLDLFMEYAKIMESDEDWTKHFTLGDIELLMCAMR